MNQRAPIGVISAIGDEGSRLAAGFMVTGSREIAGRRFRTGRLNGCPTVLVRAGIGKVNAAAAATMLRAVFNCRALVFSGVAGGLDPAMAIGDVIVGRRIVCHDYGARVNGRFVVYQPGTPPLPSVTPKIGYELPEELLGALSGALAGHRPAVSFGTLLSGDALITCDAARACLRRDLGGHAVEMEGAAVAQMAQRFRIPAVVVRAISDLAGSEHNEEIRRYLRPAADAAAEATRAILPVLNATTSRP